MITKESLLNVYMEVAGSFATLSHARRLKVGCIIVKDDRIISIGYNGMPAGWDNNCEDMVAYTKEGFDNFDIGSEYITKPEVLHAETNAIAKLAKSTESGEGATLFTTCAPCLECSKLIYQSGITQVVYGHRYKSAVGIDFLKKCNIHVSEVPLQYKVKQTLARL